MYVNINVHHFKRTLKSALMKALPGGMIAPTEVVGRDRLIERLWAALERQSLVLTAERRMGKTTVIRKMTAEPKAGLRAVSLDVEGVSTPAELVERTAQEIGSHLGASNQARRWLQDLWSTLGGTEVAGVLKLPGAKGLPWKTALERLLGGLATKPKEQFVLIWDEFPWALQKIARAEGEAVVVDLLDTLRGLRQTHPRLRLVYTGSIGLHHVLSQLQDDGWVHSPLNDMRAVQVPPLAHPDAVHLALELLKGEALDGPEAMTSAERIARDLDGVPFFIQHVVAELAAAGGPATSDAAAGIIAEALTAADDPWQLEHYRSRLAGYYGKRAAAARTLLDSLADRGPLPLAALHDSLTLDFQPDNDTARALCGSDREPLRRLLKLMQRDHYLEQDADGRFGFRFPLIRRWWRLDLGLGPLPAADGTSAADAAA
jgi:hypothetical protein